MPVSRGWPQQVPRSFRQDGSILVQPTSTGGYIQSTTFGGVVAGPAVVASVTEQPAGTSVYDLMVLARANLLAYWPMTQPAGPTLYDLKQGAYGPYNGTEGITDPTIAAYGPGITYGQPTLMVDDTGTSLFFNDVVTNSRPYIGVADSTGLAFGTSPFAAMMWMKAAATPPANSWLMSKKSQFGFFITASNQLAIDNFTTNMCTTTADMNNTNVHQVGFSTTGTSAWKIYLDGVDITATSPAGVASSNTAPLYIGCESDDFFGPAKMYVHHVSLYNAAQGPEVFMADYLTGKAIFAGIHTIEPTDVIVEA